MRRGLTIVVPMAGRGSRFAGAAPGTPKPLALVAGRLMVEWALESLKGVEYDRLVFVALEEHEDRFGVTSVLRKIAGVAAEVVLIPEVTDGQLCTVLAARDRFGKGGLLIAASDTLVVSDIGVSMLSCASDCAGLISVADMPGDRWSFARADETGRVVEVAEKRRISGHASTGLYFFADAAQFAGFAGSIVARNERTLGEFFVMPVYQRMIEAGLRIELSHAREMWDLGTPEAASEFERSRAAGAPA